MHLRLRVTEQSSYRIALIFDTGVKYQKLHTQTCQWLGKKHKGIRDDTFCIPQFFEVQYLLEHVE